MNTAIDLEGFRIEVDIEDVDETVFEVDRFAGVFMVQFCWFLVGGRGRLRRVFCRGPAFGNPPSRFRRHPWLRRSRRRELDKPRFVAHRCEEFCPAYLYHPNLLLSCLPVPEWSPTLGTVGNQGVEMLVERLTRWSGMVS